MKWETATALVAGDEENVCISKDKWALSKLTLMASLWVLNP